MTDLAVAVQEGIDAADGAEIVEGLHDGDAGLRSRVVRGHRVLGSDDPSIGTLQLTDRLITIVRATPGAHVAPHTRPLPRD